LWLVVLLTAYAAVLGGWGRERAAFDPLATRPHAIEQLIVAGRFTDALPQASALHERYPREWLPAMWLARAHHGLGHWREEAQAWEAFVRLSPAPADACPALPEAYARLNEPRRAIAAFERCTQFDPSDPGLLSDLAGAYARGGRFDDARAAYGRAAALDSGDPAMARAIAALPGGNRPDAAAALEDR